MALDGMFLHKLMLELNMQLENTRIEKIYQPAKDELIFLMRSYGGSKRLYFSAGADSARVHLTDERPENPKKPPMLCMLLRKKYSGAKFIGITQSGLERILNFEFLGTDEMGDEVTLNIIVEIMGRYSNVIFTQNGVIIDSLKRVGSGKSSVREILPGYKYILPPQQDKICILQDDQQSAQRIFENKNQLLSKAILKSVQGISPLLCNELVYRVYGNDLPVYDAEESKEKLVEALYSLKDDFCAAGGGVCLLDEKKPKEFSFTDISQFGDLYSKKEYETCSELLDKFFRDRDMVYRSSQQSGELMKNIRTSIERLSKKINIQAEELEKSNNNDELRLFGELINANLYQLKEGQAEYTVDNYYTGEKLVIEADPMLSPSENSVKYFKEYRKAETAKKELAAQIEKAEAEMDYLESIYDLLSPAETSDEVAAIKAELAENGYIKAKPSGRGKAPKELPPYKYVTSGGFTVLVGRNNKSNERLTFKTAFKTDLWFHTKNIHGSHTVLLTEKKEVPQQDIFEAAEICAYHSKGRDSSSVAVDYTEIRFVKRRPNGLTGAVFYTDYKTVYVTPERETVELKKI